MGDRRVDIVTTSSCPRTAISYFALHVFAAQLAWTDMKEVEIHANRSSDGRKMIVAKEQSDLRIVCETPSTPAGKSSVEWTVNTFTTLSTGAERMEMSERNTVVNGQLVTLHTLTIRHTSTMDIGTYECRSDSELDRVDVKIIRLASLSSLSV